MTTASHYRYNLARDTSAEAAQFVLNRLSDAYQAKVRFSPRMRSPYEVELGPTSTFWIPCGLPWRSVHARLDRCVLFLTGGPDWAREFPAGAPAPDADIIPFPGGGGHGSHMAVSPAQRSR